MSTVAVLFLLAVGGGAGWRLRGARDTSRFRRKPGPPPVDRALIERARDALGHSTLEWAGNPVGRNRKAKELLTEALGPSSSPPGVFRRWWRSRPSQR